MQSYEPLQAIEIGMDAIMRSRQDSALLTASVQYGTSPNLDFSRWAAFKSRLKLTPQNERLLGKPVSIQVN